MNVRCERAMCGVNGVALDGGQRAGESMLHIYSVAVHPCLVFEMAY